MITLATIVFGALVFSVLALFYWRERRFRRRSPFAVFTAVCAAAFSLNLLMRISTSAAVPLTVALDLVAGLISPLLLQVALEGRARPVWLTFYAIAASAAAALALDDLDLISAPFRDQLPAIMLGAAALLGLVLLRPASPLQRWYRWLLLLIAAASAASLVERSAVTVLAPDYLLLAFFCVTLYYRERLLFFDLLIKRGVFFAAALAAIAAVLSIERTADPVPLALVLSALALAAPWTEARLEKIIDRVFLRRRYSPPEAERRFLNELELAASEDNLRARAERCLADVFQSSAAVWFEPKPEPETPGGGLLLASLQNHGWAVVKARTSGIPYMSGDRRLFDSLARTLAVTLENVRFREREQQLRLLASRAELKALRAQINPHFLFNALNAVAGLIPSQPELADRTLEELAQVFRYTLRKSESEWVRLDEEADFVRAYLRVEQARFGNRLQVAIAIDPAAASARIPAMCIQPLVENAVKHGASLAEHGGTVELRGAIEGSMLHLQVRDNGPGFPAGFSLSQSEGHGLRNVAERLRGYYGGAAGLGWESATGATRVWLSIPVTPPVLPAAS